MPPITPRNPSERRKKGGALVPIAIIGTALATVGGVILWNRRKRVIVGPPAQAFLVASTAPGQPEIT